MAGIYSTNAALRPLLGDLTLDLYVEVIALEAEGISFTPRHLFGKDHLRGHRRWRRCLLQLLATSKPVDSFGVLPSQIGSVLFAHFFSESRQWVYSLHYLIGWRFWVHCNHTRYLIRVSAPVELDKEPPN